MLVGGEPRVLVRLEPGEQGRKEKRVWEDGVAPAARGPGPKRPVRGLDRAAHGRVALGVRVEQAPRPVSRRYRARNEVGHRERVLLDQRLLLRGERREGALVGASADRYTEAALVDASANVDFELERDDTGLGPPEAELLEKVEGEAVAARWLRYADDELDLGGVAGVDGSLERGPQSVPHDRVAAVVEPVVGGEHAGVPARAPRRRPGVLEPQPCRPDRPGAELGQLVGEPADRERADRDGVLADSLHGRGSLLPCLSPLLVRAARLEPTERTPVWFMRQAGRSLPEYREIRKTRTLFDVCFEPELCAEVTLQPVRRHDVDAAVLFADIMLPLLGMGVEVELVENVGPVIERPIRSRADVDRLTVPEPEESVPFVLEAVSIVRRELRADQAVVGFCGGPFTVAGYLIEGKPSRDFLNVKRLMYAEPATWHALMEKLTDTFSRYVQEQVRAGADVIQVFDSWVGALSPADYEEFVQPYSARILDAVDCPTIHFGTGTATLLGQMRDAGGDVIGLDWRIPLDLGWEAVGEDRGVQGNLDGALLLGPWERVEAGALDVLARAAGRPGHIFNLGHGVMPDTDPDVLGRLRALVHEHTARVHV